MEQFVAEEQREMTSTDPNEQNISKCFEVADHTLQNNGTQDELTAAVDAYIASLLPDTPPAAKKNKVEAETNATGKSDGGNANANANASASASGGAKQISIKLNTSNENKFKEFQRMFAAVPGSAYELTRTSVDVDEVDGTAAEVIANKATTAGWYSCGVAMSCLFCL